MGAHHRRADVLVTELFLDCSNVITRFEELRGKQMREGVDPTCFTTLAWRTASLTVR